MKKTALIALAAAFGFGAAQAGSAPSYSKNPKAPKGPQIEVPSLCDCFDPGKAELSVYGAGIIFDGGSQDDALGGGIGLGYFFTENVGVEFDYTLLATDSEYHNFTGNLVLRAPIKSACLAPYALVGGGFETDSATNGIFNVGAGIDIRLGHSGSCPGIFADARYTWNEDEALNNVLIRVGFKVNL